MVTKRITLFAILLLTACTSSPERTASREFSVADALLGTWKGTPMMMGITSDAKSKPTELTIDHVSGDQVKGTVNGRDVSGTMVDHDLRLEVSGATAAASPLVEYDLTLVDASAGSPTLKGHGSIRRDRHQFVWDVELVKQP
jgi:hypothetical protein